MSKNRYAAMVKLFPALTMMDPESLAKLGMNAEDIQAVKNPRMVGNEQNPGDGTSKNYASLSWSVVAKEAVEKFYTQLVPLTAFSTDVSAELVVQNDPRILPKVQVEVVKESSGAHIDDFTGFDKPSGSSEAVEVDMHYVWQSFQVFAYDLMHGSNIEAKTNAAVLSVAETAFNYALGRMAIGMKDGNGTGVSIAGFELPALDQFSFGYANRVLTEKIQPRVNGLLLTPEYYGALKAADKDSLTPGDLDCDVVAKVKSGLLGSLAETGAGKPKPVGLIANRRGAAVAMRGAYMLGGAYQSIATLQHGDSALPLTISTWYKPEQNCFWVTVGCYIGAKVTDASAIIPLLPAAA